MACRQTRRGLVLGVSLLALLSSACTTDTPPPPPPASTSATPTETAQEREERLAYEAAEKSYREFRDEFNRVLTAGGAKGASAQMKKTAAGSYLKDNLEVVKAYRGLGYHQEGSEQVVYVRRAGYSPASVLLATCEDASGVQIIGKKSKIVGRGDIRLLELEVRQKNGAWKVWSGTGDKVQSCDT